jgi:hypothetical protein
VNSEVLIDLKNIETLNGHINNAVKWYLWYRRRKLDIILCKKGPTVFSSCIYTNFRICYSHTHTQNQTAIIGANLKNKYFTPDVDR